MVLVNALSTGSCGNCYLIKCSTDNSNSYIMLDCGFSYKQLTQMLNGELNENLSSRSNEKINKDLYNKSNKKPISFENISHLIISHEHSDHIKGLQQILKLHSHITLIISKGTYSSLKLNYDKTIFISGNEKISINSALNIIGVEKTHDGEEPLSFIIQDNQTHKKIAFFTDLGEYNSLHINMLQLCDIVFLETNYDEELVKNSNMHYTYLQRLKSPLGHLSNTQAQELCSKYIRENQTIILSHISENVNSYNKAFNSIQQVIKSKQLQNVILKISYQQQPTGWL
ncbi:MAG: MBL fold metallo-hydrolase [Nanoarchaeota archaeon]|nr:MBL fold metallo-hydrolase [Nanoarchaeota archaeon]